MIAREEMNTVPGFFERISLSDLGDLGDLGERYSDSWQWW
jgi:hypothetical protein